MPYTNKPIQRIFLIIAVAAVVGCGYKYIDSTRNKPEPSQVSLTNPLITVYSVPEMEELLDFSIPILAKDVAAYTVIVIDNYPTLGRINYAGGITFNVMYGSQDVSGIHGGEVERTEEINGVTITYMKYDATRYAIWEKDGFSYSITGDESLESDVWVLVNQ